MKDIVYYSLSGLVFLIALLPLSKGQHWVYRLSDFIRPPWFFFQIAVLLSAFVLIQQPNLTFWICQSLLFLASLQNLVLIGPYWFERTTITPETHKSISMLSVNVYQPNKDYSKLINEVKRLKPDLLLTMESDAGWEKALDELSSSYAHSVKVPLDNLYGMHLYSKFSIEASQVHYLISPDIPCIEARITDSNDNSFIVFGVHPPPPSPTEEETSRERDGELMALAKIIRQIDSSVLVVGDFNNVPWSRSCRLFQKLTKLRDARIGFGLLPTYHAKLPIVPFPIDLLYHNEGIQIQSLQTAKGVGSDHLPLHFKFRVHDYRTANELGSEPEHTSYINRIIRKGRNREGQHSR